MHRLLRILQTRRRFRVLAIACRTRTALAPPLPVAPPSLCRLFSLCVALFVSSAFFDWWCPALLLLHLGFFLSKMSTSRPRPGGVHTDSIRGHVLYAPCLKGNSLLRAPRSSTFNFIDARRISRNNKNVHVILRFVLSLFEFYNPWILQRISSTRELASSKKGRSNAERERERAFP